MKWNSRRAAEVFFWACFLGALIMSLIVTSETSKICVAMDKGMKKVVNLVTNYMSALCETGRVPGRVDRNIKAGTAVYFPGGGAAEVIESPEDCARVLNEYFL